jgi:hypothetical protein
MPSSDAATTTRKTRVRAQSNERSACEAVKADLARAVRGRLPLQSRPFRACGREGTALVYSTTVVKVLPMSAAEHSRRARAWGHAAAARVGPALSGARLAEAAWFVPFRGIALAPEGDVEWTGWSCVHVQKLEPIAHYEALPVLALLRQTADVGLVHTDPSLENIMAEPSSPSEYRFIDWETAAAFEPRRPRGRSACHFCDVAYALMLAMLLANASLKRTPATETLLAGLRAEQARVAASAATRRWRRPFVRQHEDRRAEAREGLVGGEAYDAAVAADDHAAALRALRVWEASDATVSRSALQTLRDVAVARFEFARHLGL